MELGWYTKLYILSGLTLIVVIILGIWLSKTPPRLRIVRRALSEELKKMEKLTFEELDLLAEREPEIELQVANRKLIRELIPVTDYRVAQRKEMTFKLRIKVAVRTTDTKFSDYRIVSREKSLTGKHYYKDDKEQDKG